MTYNYTIYIYSYRLSNRVGGGRGVTGGVGSRAIARGEPGERDHTQHCSEHTAITLHTLPRSHSTLLRAHSTLCNLICLLLKKHTVNTFYFAKITLNTAKSTLRSHCTEYEDHTQYCAMHTLIWSPCTENTLREGLKKTQSQYQSASTLVKKTNILRSGLP